MTDRPGGILAFSGTFFRVRVADQKSDMIRRSLQVGLNNGGGSNNKQGSFGKQGSCSLCAAALRKTSVDNQYSRFGGGCVCWALGLYFTIFFLLLHIPQFMWVFLCKENSQHTPCAPEISDGGSECGD